MKLFVLQLVGQLLVCFLCPWLSITWLQPLCCYCLRYEQCVAFAAPQQTSFHVALGMINSSPAQASPSIIAHLIRSLYRNGHISFINFRLITVAGRIYGKKQITIPRWIRVQMAIWSLYYLWAVINYAFSALLYLDDNSGEQRWAEVQPGGDDKFHLKNKAVRRFLWGEKKTCWWNLWPVSASIHFL